MLLVSVFKWLFHTVPWVGLRSVIEVFLILHPCFWLLSGPPGFTYWISFAPVFSFMYCLVLIFALSLFGTRDLFNISYSRELYLFSKFLHFEEIVRVKMAVCFEMIVSET